MTFLYKISTFVVALAIVAGLSFSTSYAHTTKENTNNAQTETLYEKVMNNQDYAVADSQISILSGAVTMQTTNSDFGSKTSTTNRKDQIKAKNDLPGIYTVKVKASGYKTARELVMITENKSLTLKLESLH